MLTAVEYLGKVGVGITCPEFFRADDGKIYVVKRSDNYVGWQVLVSEILAANFGEKLKLPFPNAAIIELKNFLTSQKKFSPLAFASAFIDHAQYATKDNILQTQNLKEMAGIILFDHLFHNGDRAYNRKNLLVAEKSNRLFLYGIDHSHLFNTGRWNMSTISGIAGQIKLYINDLCHMVLRDHLTKEDFLPYQCAMRRLSHAEIEEILAAIPDEWINDGLTRKTLYSFIYHRCQRVDEIVEAILNAKEKHRLKQ